MSDDLFEDADRADHAAPVTRGQMRVIVAGLRKDLRWAVAVTIVANQTLNHVEIPQAAGFIGGIGILLLGAAKLLIVR